MGAFLIFGLIVTVYTFRHWMLIVRRTLFGIALTVMSLFVLELSPPKIWVALFNFESSLV